MGKVKIDENVFDKVKVALERSTKAQAVKKFKLSQESVRLISLTPSWRSWQLRAAKRRRDNRKPAVYVLQYEDVPQKSNWFVEKLRNIGRQ